MSPVARTPNQQKKRTRSLSPTGSVHRPPQRPRSESPIRTTPYTNMAPDRRLSPSDSNKSIESGGSSPHFPIVPPPSTVTPMQRTPSYAAATDELAQIMHRKLSLSRISVPERPKTPPLPDKDDKNDIPQRPQTTPLPARNNGNNTLIPQRSQTTPLPAKAI